MHTLTLLPSPSLPLSLFLSFRHNGEPEMPELFHACDQIRTRNMDGKKGFGPGRPETPEAGPGQPDSHMSL